MRLQITVAGWQEIQDSLAYFTADQGQRMAAPALAAAARIVARKARTRDFVFLNGPNRRIGAGGRSGPRLRRTIRSGIFRSGRLKGKGARVIAGGRGARHANPLHAGQSGGALPYRGGPQDAAPRPFLLEAALSTQAGQEAAFAANLRKRLPGLLRRLQARAKPGAPIPLGAAFVRGRLSRSQRRRRR